MFTTAITAIATLLASATFIWTASIIIIVAMMVLLENEYEGWATTLFSLGIALFLWNFRMDIWQYLSTNPTATIGFAVTYVLLGITWSFLKWRSYVKAVFDKAREIKDEFVRKNGDITDSNRKQFNKKIENAHFKGPDGYSASIYDDDTFEKIADKISPLASHKKSIITSWISYWPVSLAGTLLNNPFRQFFEWIYSNLSGYYDKITNKYKKDAFGI